MSPLREMWRLTALHIRLRFGLSLWRTGGRRDTMKRVGVACLIVYGLFIILLMETLIGFPFIRAGVAQGMGLVVLGAIVLSAFLIVLFFGLFGLIGIVFSARDAAFYAALPLRPQSLFVAKFCMVYLTELGITALIYLPLGIMYGVTAQMGVLFYLLLILIWLILPVIPLAAATLLSMPLVRLLSKVKYRDALLLVLSFALMILLVSGQMLLSASFENADTPEGAARLAEWFQTPGSLLETVAGRFPPALWAARALAGIQHPALNLLMLLGVTVLAFVLTTWLAQKTYYRGVLAQLESPRGKTKGYRQSAVRRRSAAGAIWRKELRILLRTPAYAMNGLSMVVIMPLMILLGGVRSGGGESTTALAGVFENIPSAFIPAAAALLVAFISALNIITATTFSREGSCFWFVQAIPVPTGIQILGRLAAGMTIGLVGSAAALAAMMAVAPLPPVPLLAGALVGLCVSAPMQLVGMLPDILSPKLKWNSEAEAVKQNMNTVFGMLLQLGAALPLILPAALLYGLTRSAPLALLAAALTGLAAGALLFYGLSKLLRRRLPLMPL